VTDRKAMQQAIEAMEYADACLKKQLTTKTKHEYAQDLLMEAGTVLRERLAQPEQEPVFDCPRCGHCCPPQGIYYTPPQRKPLTDAVLAEREACAAMLDANAMACENPIYRSLLQANAQAIREMGQP